MPRTTRKEKFEWASIPIINYINVMTDDDEKEALRTALLAMHNAHGEEHSVAFHQARLGRQKFCYDIAGRRFWVWEAEDWRIFANDIAGTSFEVRADISFDISKDRAMEAFGSYRRKVGLLP